MKKRLLSFCIALMALSVHAQIPQYFKTGTTNGSNYIPIGGSLTGPGTGWENNRSQLLYLAGEFGVVPPGSITTIYFRPSVAITATYTNFRIDLGQSNITTLTTAWETGLTTALTLPTHVMTSVVNQWLPITLANPVAFDPTKSLIVDIRQTNTVPVMAIALNNFNSPSGNRRTWTWNPTFNSTSPTPGGPGIDPGTGIQYDFGFDLLTSCDSPINIKTVPTRFTADITWDPRPGATSYEYLIDQSPLNPPSSGYNFTNSPVINLKNLPDGICYYIHVRTVCGTAMMSGWSLDSFCTIADCKVPEVTISNIQSTTAIASWAAVPGATGYVYSVGTTPDTPTSGNNTTYTSVKLQGLWPDKPLYFYVRAKCSPTPQSEWGVTPFHTEHYTGVEDIDNSLLSVEAFPNPVKDVMQLKVRGTRGKNAAIIITDITGRTIQTRTIEAAETEINMNGFAAGAYYLKYSDDSHKELIKITKQ